MSAPGETERSRARPGPSVEELLADLDDERATVMALLRDLPPEDWARPTRAVPWTVRDQVAHLGWFDGAFARAISTPEAFEAERDAITDVEGFVDAANAQVPASGPASLAYWQDAAAAFDRAVRACDPSSRLPWFGPAMSLRSAITSRIMETWAHGADVADALRTRLAPGDRLRHVADLAVRARPQGYRVRGLDVPETPVRVELTGPSGAVWTWGDVGAATGSDSITGDAEEFCLVLVRRRHVDDTALDVTGDAARGWMLLGQAFAGTPGTDPVRA